MALTSTGTKAIGGLEAAKARLRGGRPLQRARSARSRGRTQPRRVGALVAGGAAGAAGAYFLDPNSGKRRRHIARDRVASFFRSRAADAQRGAEYAKGHAKGAAYEATRPLQPERPAANDQALADRVKSEIFRPADAPKGTVNVNVENGVVYLRGEVSRPEEIESLVAAAESVDGVRSVENLLHLPGTPAQTKGDGRKAGTAASR
jgi:osmotically-inducible protein OsmY